MINEYKRIIEENLEKYFDERLQNPEYGLFKDVIESMKYTTCLGGKRLRAVFVLKPAEYFQEIIRLQSPQHAQLKCSTPKV